MRHEALLKLVFSLSISSLLKVFLESRPKDEIRKIVSLKTNGATPLVIASKNGHLDVVEYLLTKCNADIEQVRHQAWKLN